MGTPHAIILYMLWRYVSVYLRVAIYDIREKGLERITMKPSGRIDIRI